MTFEQARSWTILALTGLLLYVSIVAQAARLFSRGPKPTAGSPFRRFWVRFLWAPIVWDRVGLVPFWMFFSAPPKANVRLLIRDRLCEGDFSPWQTVHFACDHRIK